MMGGFSYGRITVMACGAAPLNLKMIDYRIQPLLGGMATIALGCSWQVF
ncbi:MAG: hypothetical protein ABW166_10835 [Sedimenticola sp.]